MHPSAIEHAAERLDKARRALDRLEAATTFEAAEEAWTDFLLAAGAIFSKFEQGSKGFGRSSAWFGRIKHRRKTDPILRYIHFARNSDEHGVERTVEREHANPIFRDSPIGTRETKELTLVYHPQGKPLGEKLIAHVYGKHLRLRRVKDDRFGDYADPPADGFDRWKDPLNPLDVGRAALPLLSAIIQEASSLQA